MFALHETTRKRVCRTAFFALCVAPTLATAGWIGFANRSWRDDDEARRLAAALRARVTLAGWQTPRPGASRFAEALLTDATTGGLLVNLGRSECWRRRDVRMISAATATVDLSNAAVLSRRIETWLAELAGVRTELRIEELVVKMPNRQHASESATETYTLKHVRIQIEPADDGGVHVQLTARPAERGDAAATTLHLTVDRSTSATRVSVNSTQAPLPAALIALAMPGADGLGPHATFAGELQLEFQGEQRLGAARGRIDRAELAALLPESSPHRLLGEGRVELEQVQWSDERFTHLAGSLHAESAKASRSLIDTAVDKLYCRQVAAGVAAVSEVEGTPMPTVVDTTSLVAFDLLACQFTWNAHGLTILGSIPTSENPNGGCLATSGGTPLLLEPAHAGLSVGHWMQFVAGQAVDYLPATRESIDHASPLPLPGAAARQ